MIVISDCSKDIVIPAGLGDNAGVVYETAGVKSLNGETGDLKIKTVNGNDMLGEGDIEIKGGVETVNGETGDVKIKTVNGQSLMGEGDVPVDVGVETLNGQKGDLKIKSVNGTEMLGEGNVAIDTGVESLNGQKGALTLKTVNGNELTGDGNIEIQAGVSSVNGKTGDVTVYDLGNYAICALQMSDITLSEEDTDVMLYNYGAGYDNGGWSRYMSGDRTVQILLIGTKDRRGYKVPVEIHLMHDNQENAEMHFTIGDYRYVYSQVSNMHWRFTSKTPVNSGAGSDNVIVLDGLTQEERKAVYDKLDKTKAPDEVFVYEGKTSVRAYWGGGNHLKFITFNENYNGLKVDMFSLDPDGNLGYEDRGMTYTNSVLMHLGNHVDESGYFECMYIGNFFEYILRPYTRPNACFINLEKGIGDSTRPIYAPVSTLVEKYGDRNNVRMQFFANEKLYTFLLDPNQDNKWLFESVKPITGGVQSSEVSNIKVLTQAEYDALTSKDENVLYCIKG